MPAASSPVIAAALLSLVIAVHDGDTFTLQNGTKIRVFGIDAPELNQQCKTAAGQCTPCGEGSRQQLADLILHKALTCVERGKSYDRTVAECSVDGLAIGPEMLRRGAAGAYKQYLRKSDAAYLAAEREARDAHTGLWSEAFVPPADWRNHRARLECER